MYMILRKMHRRVVTKLLNVEQWVNILYNKIGVTFYLRILFSSFQAKSVQSNTTTRLGHFNETASQHISSNT